MVRCALVRDFHLQGRNPRVVLTRALCKGTRLHSGNMGTTGGNHIRSTQAPIRTSPTTRSWCMPRHTGIYGFWQRLVYVSTVVRASRRPLLCKDECHERAEKVPVLNGDDDGSPFPSNVSRVGSFDILESGEMIAPGALVPSD